MVLGNTRLYSITLSEYPKSEKKMSLLEGMYLAKKDLILHKEHDPSLLYHSLFWDPLLSRLPSPNFTDMKHYHLYDFPGSNVS